MTALPSFGVGVSYRSPWRHAVRAQRDRLGCLEIMADDYLDRRPERERELSELSDLFPLLPHAIATSLGTDEPLDEGRLRQLAELVERTNAPWASEHLAFTHAHGLNLGHLASLPFSREAVAVVVRNARRWRSVVGVPLLVENIACVVPLPGELTEAQFLTEIVEGADCGLLLDLHNVHANAINHGFDAHELLSSLPLERVGQIHLGGGHDAPEGFRMDSHSSATPEPVWELLGYVAARAEVNAVIVEWDLNLPPFEVMLAEVARAEALLREASHGAARFAGSTGAAVR